jgi:hypothetical protein
MKDCPCLILPQHFKMTYASKQQGRSRSQPEGLPAAVTQLEVTISCLFFTITKITRELEMIYRKLREMRDHNLLCHSCLKFHAISTLMMHEEKQPDKEARSCPSSTPGDRYLSSRVCHRVVFQTASRTSSLDPPSLCFLFLGSEMPSPYGCH